jgi:hypothetical protein
MTALPGAALQDKKSKADPSLALVMTGSGKWLRIPASAVSLGVARGFGEGVAKRTV